MNTLTIHKTTHASTSYGWLEYGLEYRIGNAEIHRIFSSSLIHCALDYWELSHPTSNAAANTLTCL